MPNKLACVLPIQMLNVSNVSERRVIWGRYLVLENIAIFVGREMMRNVRRSET
jgi:hypothetical protein